MLNEELNAEERRLGESCGAADEFDEENGERLGDNGFEEENDDRFNGDGDRVFDLSKNFTSGD